MSSLMNRLAALHADDLDGVADAVVVADLARARVARSQRRRRRSVTAGVASVGLLALSSVGYLALSADGSGATKAQPPDAIATISRSAAPAPAATTAQVNQPIALVAYTGDQLPGYSVKRIPDGYVLQGISSSVLDVAQRGDHSPLDSFVGKIVVMLNDHPGSSSGLAVSVNGNAGRISREDGVLALTYSDGKHNVELQSWSNIRITPEQLVVFAEGVTVLGNAQTGHG